jgi:SAM-dependent methyltransferase
MEPLAGHHQRTEYETRFATRQSAQHYEDTIYHPGSYDSFIWSLQKPYLIKVVENVRLSTGSISYLDFACGTGRIISALESVAQFAVGVDISDEMVAIAANKTNKARFIVGDVLKFPNLLDRPFDVITAFRYFLNVDNETRYRTMSLLAQHLRDDGSRLVFNVHGNSTSSRHLSIVARRLVGLSENELSFGEVQAFVQTCGLEIESYYGFGFFPRKFVVLDPTKLSKRFEAWITNNQLLGRFCHDIVFICRRSRRLSQNKAVDKIEGERY